MYKAKIDGQAGDLVLVKGNLYTAEQVEGLDPADFELVAAPAATDEKKEEVAADTTGAAGDEKVEDKTADTNTTGEGSADASKKDEAGSDVSSTETSILTAEEVEAGWTEKTLTEEDLAAEAKYTEEGKTVGDRVKIAPVSKDAETLE